MRHAAYPPRRRLDPAIRRSGVGARRRSGELGARRLRQRRGIEEEGREAGNVALTGVSAGRATFSVL